MLSFKRVCVGMGGSSLQSQRVSGDWKRVLLALGFFSGVREPLSHGYIRRDLYTSESSSVGQPALTQHHSTKVGPVFADPSDDVSSIKAVLADCFHVSRSA